MADLNSTITVCCMCGDIGFPDKLFQCTKCCHRFQHSYCSNYSDESTVTSAAATGLFCDWCLSEEKAKPAASGVSTKKYSPSTTGEKIKHNDSKAEGSGTTAPSPKTPGRRYKFLKDVLC